MGFIGVPKVFHGVSDHFRGVSYFFRKFQWISGGPRGVTRGFRGAPGIEPLDSDLVLELCF